MPTAGKLVAAILWGAMAWYVSELVKPAFPEGTSFGRFSEYNILIGLVVGWVVAGSRVGKGYVSAVGYGVTATVALMFWGLFIYSFVQMIKRSLRKLYDGATEAVISVFELSIEYAKLVFTSDVLVTLAVGAVIAGITTEYFGRRFP